MTRDEQRTACIEAMEAAYWAFDNDDKVRDYLTAAFDGLYGIAKVVPVTLYTGLGNDLTNPPKEKDF